MQLLIFLKPISVAVLIFGLYEFTHGSDDPSTILQNGNDMYEMGRFNEAISMYKVALALLSDESSMDMTTVQAAVWTNMGLSYRELKQYDESFQCHREALHLLPYSDKMHYNLGVTLQEAGKLHEAVEAYSSAIEYSSTALLDTTTESDNMDDMPHSKSTSNNLLNAYYNSGIAYQDLGQLSEALAQYSQVLKRMPVHTDARLNSCNILFAQGKHSVAEKCYMDVLQVDPTHVRAMVNLASFYEMTGMNKKSGADDDNIDYVSIIRELYSRALELDPTNVYAQHALRASSASNKQQQHGIVGRDEEEIPHEYIVGLFDSYSFHFDTSLKDLNYSSHETVADTVRRHFCGHFDCAHSNTDNDAAAGIMNRRLIRILDLGAGTGLACQPMRRAISQAYQSESRRTNNSMDDGRNMEIDVSIVAVDLSIKMLQKAKAPSCYNQIVVSDIVSYCEKMNVFEEGTFDVVVAADVFVYIGNLTTVLQSIRRVLALPCKAGIDSCNGNEVLDKRCDANEKSGSLVVFTVEEMENDDSSFGKQSQLPFHMSAAGRFQHTKEYIEEVAEISFFSILDISSVVLRWDRGTPVRGLAVALVCRPYC